MNRFDPRGIQFEVGDIIVYAVNSYGNQIRMNYAPIKRIEGDKNRLVIPGFGAKKEIYLTALNRVYVLEKGNKENA
jgi:hypothetical protein